MYSLGFVEYYCNEGKILIHIPFFPCKVFTANGDRNTVVTNYLEPPIVGARYVRIQPQDWNVHISLRFEILGCDYQGKETIKWIVLSIILICFLITLYIPITCEDLSVFLGTWMLSHPKTNDMWYDKLSKSMMDENRLQNLNQAKDDISDDRCLVMSKVSSSDLMFSLGVQDCNVKQAAICRVKPPMIATPPKPPKFPCHKLNQVDRRKRSPGDEKLQERGKNEGSLVVKSV